MAINVKHGVNAGAVAGAAFGGAQGQARQRAAIGAAQAATEEERRRRGLLARQQAVAADAPPATVPAEPAAPVWDPKLGGSPPVGYDPQVAALAAMTPEQREARARMDYASQIRQREAAAAQERTQQNTEFSLTTKQRMDLEQLASAEAEAMASPDFTAAEKEELRRRFAAKRAGIQPVERPKAPTPAELFRQRTYTDQRTGRVYSLDADGVPGRAIYEPPERQPTMQDRRGAYETAGKLLTANLAPGDPAPSLERIQEVANLILSGGSMAGGGAAPGSAAWGQGEGGDPSMAGYAAVDGDLETRSGRYDDPSSLSERLEAETAAAGRSTDTMGRLALPGAASPAVPSPEEDAAAGGFWTSPGMQKVREQEAAEARSRGFLAGAPRLGVADDMRNERVLTRLTQAKPNTAVNLDPAEVNDLPTARHQLQEARARLAEAERLAEQTDQKLEPLSGRNTVAEFASRGLNPLTQGASAAREAKAKREAFAERVAKLEARERALTEQAEEAEMFRIAKASARGGR